MRIGKHRERIKIITLNTVKDTGGGYLGTGEDQFTENFEEDFGTGEEQIYWETNAEVSDVKDKYKVESFEIGIEESCVFTLRDRSDKTVTKLMQVIYKNRRYTIHGIDPVGYRGKELRLTCKSRE